jgi:hypothetical protein
MARKSLAKHSDHLIGNHDSPCLRSRGNYMPLPDFNLAGPNTCGVARSCNTYFVSNIVFGDGFAARRGFAVLNRMA